MKNQYFGDKRDLFKYDLMTEIGKKIPSIARLAFIPMLTPNNGKGGNEFDYRVGSQNHKLMVFLETCVKQDRRDIGEIARYFEEVRLDLHIYKQVQYFTQAARQSYFADIPDNLLTHALVFLDPDTGMAEKSSEGTHLLYEEAHDLYKRLDAASILMVYQHHHRYIPRRKFLADVARTLHEVMQTKELPRWISDKQISFFFLVKDAGMGDQLAKVLSEYRSLYPKLLSSANNQ